MPTVTTKQPTCSHCCSTYFPTTGSLDWSHPWFGIQSPVQISPVCCIDLCWWMGPISYSFSSSTPQQVHSKWGPFRSVSKMPPSEQQLWWTRFLRSSCIQLWLLYRFVLMNKGLSMLSPLLTKVSRLYLSYDSNEVNFFWSIFVMTYLVWNVTLQNRGFKEHIKHIISTLKHNVQIKVLLLIKWGPMQCARVYKGVRSTNVCSCMQECSWETSNHISSNTHFTVNVWYQCHPSYDCVINQPWTKCVNIK